MISKFRRAFSFLFRLQWKLTISYTLVTITVLTILLVASIFISSLMTNNLPQLTLMLSQALNSASTRLAPALEQVPPDTQAVQKWINSSFQGSAVLFNNQNDDEVSISYSSMAGPDTVLAVLDAGGRVITSNHPEKLAAGQPVPEDLLPSLNQLIARIQEGEEIPARLMDHEEKYQIAAAPVKARDGRLVGITFLYAIRPTPLQVLGISIISIFPAILVLSVVAVLIGSLFGAVTARSITRRLKSAMKTTSAWGSGDFSARVNDQSQDEIGQLASDLNRMADQLQDLMRTRQELAALEERNYLARELHDSAKQQVFATSMNLAAAKALWVRNPEEARKRVEIAVELSRQSQQELTTLIQTLRPKQHDRKSLQLTLCESAKIWERQYGIIVNCKITGQEHLLPPEMEQALFRVAQEALSNVARHSGATSVTLILSHRVEEICLDIRDDGHGFDINQPVRGLGLRSMQERINALGGCLTIHSQPDGTILEARVPFTRSKNT
jgi:two-component system, NarL family, sensor histidine kinase LiaS